MDKTLDDKIDTILASQGVATIEAQTVRALGGSKEDMERAMNHSFNMAKDDIKNLITQEAAAARVDELEVLRTHLLGDIYDENDTDFENYKPLRDKISERVETLRSELLNKEKNE